MHCQHVLCGSSKCLQEIIHRVLSYFAAGVDLEATSIPRMQDKESMLLSVDHAPCQHILSKEVVHVHL